MALPMLVLIGQAIEDAVRVWRWKRALERGEIKHQPFREKIRARYLAATTIQGIAEKSNG